MEKPTKGTSSLADLGDESVTSATLSTLAQWSSLQSD